MFIPMIVALVSFLVFVVLSVLFSVTSGETSSRALIKMHLLFSLLYVAGAVVSDFLFQPPVTVLDWLIGGFVYLSLHYSFFMYLHAVPRKSVSVNLCVEVMQQNGPTQEELQKGYGQGKGMEFVVNDRLQSMEHMGMVKREGDALVLTTFGLVMARVHFVMLKLWSMRSNSGAENG